MKEVIGGVSFQEFNLTMVRLMCFMNSLGLTHNKKTTKDRLALYDFYLKYPELIDQSKDKLDFDTKYSYFHWIPNYNFYSSVLANLQARGLIDQDENSNYFITELGTKLVGNMTNKYIDRIMIESKFLITKVCKLSSKSIMDNINDLIYKERGM